MDLTFFSHSSPFKTIYWDSPSAVTAHFGSIMERSKSINGSAIVAMTGLNCVAIATDTRYGSGSLTISSDAPKVFQLKPKMFVGFAGLYSDALTLYEELNSRIYLYNLAAKSHMCAKTATGMLSSLLFEKRFGNYMVDSIVASLENHSVFLSTLDSYGYPSLYNNYVAAGTCKTQLLGLCETFWKPNLETQELFDIISQTILNSVDKDPLSGCGVIIYMVTDNQTVVRTLKARID